MHIATVVQVLDGNTVSVWPPLDHEGSQGNIIRIRGMASPPLSHPRGELARARLTLCILGSVVHVGGVEGVSHGAFLCEVQYCGRNLIQHFPEYAAPGDGSPIETMESPESMTSGSSGAAWQLEP